MATLIVVSGPPGAGKSSVAALLVQRFERSVLVPGDAFFAFLERSAMHPWLPGTHEQNETVIAAAAAASGRFATGGYTTVYDGVVGPWFLPAFARAAGLPRLDYVMLLPPVERCVRQVMTRTDHAFDDEPATRKMHADFAKAPIDERHVIRDLGVDPEAAVAEIVARLADDSLVFSAHPPPTK